MFADARLLELAVADRFSLERPERTSVPQMISSGTQWQVEIVLPYYGDRLQALSVDGEDPNRCSAVVRVTMAGRGTLISGDATLDSWERLDITPAVLIRVPHHGGDLGSGVRWRASAELYRAVDP